MKAYYLVFFIMFLISLFYQAKTDKEWRWKLFWTFLPLFIYGAIRVDYGNDYPMYESFFDTMHKLPLFTFDSELHAELGFQLLNQLLPSFRSVLVLSAFLLSFSLGIFCYRNVPRKYLWLAVLLIFLNPEKNIFGILVGIRTGLVVSSFLLAFPLIQNRKLILFGLFAFGLGFLHTSAYIFLPIAYFVGFNKPFTKKEFYVWLLVTVILLTLSMTSLFDMVTVLIGNEYFDRYEYYLDDSTMHRGVLSAISHCINLALFSIYLLNVDKLTKEQNSTIRIGMFFSVMALLGSLSMRSSIFYDMFFIASVVIAFSDKRANLLLRISLLTMALVTSYYSMFHIWMGSEWWNHEVYHSLIGNW